MLLATTSRTILIPTRTTIRRRKQRTAGVACARLRRISQVCWRNDVVQSRNLPRRLDVFDALDAGLRMQRVFTPAVRAGILWIRPRPWVEHRGRTRASLRIRFVSLRESFCSSDSEMLADDFGCLLKLGPCTSEHYRSATQHEEHVPYG